MPLKFENLTKITKFLVKNFWGGPKMPFLKQKLSKMKIFVIFLNKFRNCFQKLKKNKKPWVKFPRTQGKNPKLKQKTQTFGGSCLGLPPNCML